MKKLHIDWSNGTKETVQLMPSQYGNIRRHTTLLGAAVAGLLLAMQSAQAGSVFVIAMENHNLTQPNPTSNPQQILGNAAAPHL